MIKSDDTSQSNYGFALHKLNSLETLSSMELMRQEWAEEIKADPNRPHISRNVYSRAVAINDRFYIFHNISDTNLHCVKIVDPLLRCLFDVKLFNFS